MLLKGSCRHEKVYGDRVYTMSYVAMLHQALAVPRRDLTVDVLAPSTLVPLWALTQPPEPRRSRYLPTNMQRMLGTVKASAQRRTMDLKQLVVINVLARRWPAIAILGQSWW